MYTMHTNKLQTLISTLSINNYITTINNCKVQYP